MGDALSSPGGSKERSARVRQAHRHRPQGAMSVRRGRMASAKHCGEDLCFPRWPRADAAFEAESGGSILRCELQLRHCAFHNLASPEALSEPATPQPIWSFAVGSFGAQSDSGKTQPSLSNQPPRRAKQLMARDVSRAKTTVSSAKPPPIARRPHCRCDRPKDSNPWLLFNKSICHNNWTELDEFLLFSCDF